MEDKALVNVGSGVAVERDVLGVVEAIHEYDPNLKVQFLAEAAALNEPPFRILELCRDGHYRVAFQVWQLDNSVLDRIYAADTGHHDIDRILREKNEKARQDEKRRYREKLEEASDITRSVIRSPKQSYTVKHPETGKIMRFE